MYVCVGVFKLPK